MRKGMKLLGGPTVLLIAVWLFYLSGDLPYWADSHSRASTYLSSRYIERTVGQTSVTNVVTSILADYRGLDAMIETSVIFTAAIVCFFLLRRTSQERLRGRLYRHLATGVTLRLDNGADIAPSEDFEQIDRLWIPHDLVVKTVCQGVIPFIQIFAFVVIAHQDHSPGGGFPGGVLLGASIILFAIAFDLRTAMGRIREKTVGMLCAVGVFMFASVGILSLVFGGFNFLDYSAFARLLGVSSAVARSCGIFVVEIGVALAVMATMIWIYSVVASAGKGKQGL